MPLSNGVLSIGCAWLLRGDVAAFVEDVLVALDVHDDDEVVLELNGTLTSVELLNCENLLNCEDLLCGMCFYLE